MKTKLSPLFCLVLLMFVLPQRTNAALLSSENNSTSFSITTNVIDVVKSYGELEITGIVSNKTSSSITGFTIGLVYDGKVFTQEFPTITLVPNGAYQYTLDKKLEIARNQTISYSVYIEKDGAKTAVDATVSAYLHKIVAEELTGTWCGFCTRGIVAMDNMREKYPDTFIGIAVHGSDVMEHTPHKSGIMAYGLPGYPSSITNRVKERLGDPSNFEYYYSLEYNKTPPCGLEAEGVFDPETKEVTAKGIIYFAQPQSDIDYRFSYIVIENNINVPDNADYNQANYYADNRYGPMGGYESKPNKILAADMNYMDVSRYIGGDFNGIEGSIPATVDASSPYEHTYNFTLPTSILNHDQLELVGLVIDGKTNQIVNADKVQLNAASSTSIKEMKEKQDVIIIVDNERIIIESESPIEKVSLLNANGQIINSFNVNLQNNVIMPTPNMKGIYIVQVKIDNKVYSYKVPL